MIELPPARRCEHGRGAEAWRPKPCRRLTGVASAHPLPHCAAMFCGPLPPALPRRPYTCSRPPPSAAAPPVGPVGVGASGRSAGRARCRYGRLQRSGSPGRGQSRGGEGTALLQLIEPGPAHRRYRWQTGPLMSGRAASLGGEAAPDRRGGRAGIGSVVQLDADRPLDPLRSAPGATSRAGAPARGRAARRRRCWRAAARGRRGGRSSSGSRWGITRRWLAAGSGPARSSRRARRTPLQRWRE
jgi:hypothetical protein